MILFCSSFLVSGLPSSPTSSNGGRHPLHPHLSGLHPRAVGPAPVGKAGEPSKPCVPPPDLAHGASPELFICCPLSKACVNIHTDFCDSAAVPVMYSVRLTQVSQCGQASHQCHGDPPYRCVLLPSPLQCIQVVMCSCSCYVWCPLCFWCNEEMIDLFPVLTRAKRYSFFMPILPCLVAFCQAFPPLYDDVAALLVQVGQVCASDVSTKARDIDPSITRKYDSFCKDKNTKIVQNLMIILTMMIPGLQYLKAKPREATSATRGLSKLTLPQKTAEQLGGADPDVQLCYCVEATFMDIISSTLHGL